MDINDGHKYLCTMFKDSDLSGRNIVERSMIIDWAIRSFFDSPMFVSGRETGFRLRGMLKTIIEKQETDMGTNIVKNFINSIVLQLPLANF